MGKVTTRGPSSSRIELKDNRNAIIATISSIIAAYKSFYENKNIFYGYLDTAV